MPNRAFNNLWPNWLGTVIVLFAALGGIAASMYHQEDKCEYWCIDGSSGCKRSPATIGMRCWSEYKFGPVTFYHGSKGFVIPQENIGEVVRF